MAKHLLGNCAINIGNDNFIIPLPAINVTLASGRSLVCSGNRKFHFVHTGSQI